MNDSPEDQELDRQLREWADRRELPGDRLESLERRVTAAMGKASSDRAVRPEHPATPQRSSRPNKLVLLAVLGIGLCIGGLLVLSWRWVRPEPSPPITNNGSSSTDVVPSTQFGRWERAELREQALLAAELDELFQDRWQWIVAAGDDSAIQISDSTNADPRPHVAVRVVVVKRDVGDDEWTPVWRANCVSRSEELVRFEGSAPEDGSLLLWTYPLDDELVEVECQLAVGKGREVRTQYSVAQPAGVPVQASTFRQGDTEYAFIHTVAMLREENSL